MNLAIRVKCYWPKKRVYFQVSILFLLSVSKQNEGTGEWKSLRLCYDMIHMHVYISMCATVFSRQKKQHIWSHFSSYFILNPTDVSCVTFKITNVYELVSNFGWRTRLPFEIQTAEPIDAIGAHWCYWTIYIYIYIYCSSTRLKVIIAEEHSATQYIAI